ncbi:hypothetical protein [Algibacter pectinivorans]|uniref:Uncharacterized protein n=1 Tax=Algibacter pectinivorans TaxID=870482 RepID=A0A1I1SFF1_9FLAO|nr:hypothetical protein [Algibacter pectinivorans]SFD41740.1 hypothetical protein SAMN04487987_11329 [Algibacter pectinivorans]
MSDNLIKSTTCKELLKTVDKEKSEIIDKIDLFYEENKSDENLRELLYDKFNNVILNFHRKYYKINLATVNETEQVTNLHFKCSNKITERVTSLESYIDSIAPLD